MGIRLLALVPAAALAAACAPGPAPAPSPAPARTSRSAVPSPSPSPLPLKKQHPCDLLTRADQDRYDGEASEFEKKPKDLYGDRSCQYHITRAEDGSFFTLSITFVEHAEPLDPVEPVERIGRHRGALTDKEKLGGAYARYSIVVSRRSRVDVFFSAGTYRDRAEAEAAEYAALIEPRLP